MWTGLAGSVGSAGHTAPVRTRHDLSRVPPYLCGSLLVWHGFGYIVQFDIQRVAYPQEHVGRDVLVLAELGEG